MIEALRIKTEVGTIRVTCSIGVASVGTKDPSVAASLKRADKALYIAKNSGRNRVETFSSHGKGEVHERT